MMHGVTRVTPCLVPLQHCRRAEGALAPPPRDVVPAHQAPPEAEERRGAVVKARGQRGHPMQPPRRAARHLDLRRAGDGDPRQRLGGGDQQVTRGGGVPTEAVTHGQLEDELAIGRQERGRDAHARRVRGLGE
eukprot:CAMPEP_0118834390 /NCGR_PEP_ID=MMETSP1162-20130426/49457_1 /TAXON_ID=33656 /ORGANISM="Phaeocystis Sp, Strain CCMP2710" /LENGTH=132 /DNA_ID=CAMNT_0006766107 /DNA_START=104 /DNA_END=499 /DNA_ORIENTATION=-